MIMQNRENTLKLNFICEPENVKVMLLFDGGMIL